MPGFINGIIAGIMNAFISIIINSFTESLGTLGLIPYAILNAFCIYLFIEWISDIDYWGISYTFGWLASLVIITMSNILGFWELLLDFIITIIFIVRKIKNKY